MPHSPGWSRMAARKRKYDSSISREARKALMGKLAFETYPKSYFASDGRIFGETDIGRRRLSSQWVRAIGDYFRVCRNQIWAVGVSLRVCVSF